MLSVGFSPKAPNGAEVYFTRRFVSGTETGKNRFDEMGQGRLADKKAWDKAYSSHKSMPVEDGGFGLQSGGGSGFMSGGTRAVLAFYFYWSHHPPSRERDTITNVLQN